MKQEKAFTEIWGSIDLFKSMSMDVLHNPIKEFI